MGLKLPNVLNLALCVTAIGTAQNSSYKEAYPDKITARSSLQTTSNSFELKDRNTNTKTEYLPNDKSYLGISLSFRAVELDIGYAPNFLSENKDNGDSKLINLNFRMFFNQFMQTVDFYKQKGFFVRTEDLTLPVDNLRTLKIGGSTNYIANPDFSFRAIGSQNEWQKRSAGSFIPGATYYYTKFKLEDPVLDNQIEHSFKLAAGPGYYHNWVFDENYIVSAGGIGGLGFNLSKTNGDTSLSGLAQVIFRLSGGYNSPTFFGGLTINSQLLTNASKANVVLDDAISFLELYVGYRFNAPKKWIEKADEINRKLGLDKI